MATGREIIRFRLHSHDGGVDNKRECLRKPRALLRDATCLTPHTIWSRSTKCPHYQWPNLLKEAYKVLKPGGIIEFAEFGLRWECMDGTFDPEGNCGRWTKSFHQIATEVLGMDFDPIPKMQGWMQEAGFEDVVMADEIVPVGPWPRDRKLKNVGRYFLSNMLEGGVENYTLMLFTKAGWDETSVQAMLGGVRRELLDPRIHAFTRA